jgi:hypothetical protein
MKSNKVIPEMACTPTEHAIQKYSRNNPILNWDNDRGLRSGWNLFRVLKTNNVCFRDETKDSNRMWFVIEYPTKKCCLFDNNHLYALGFFFVRHPAGHIDLMYRIKTHQGREFQCIYKDCIYFGVENEMDENILRSKFVVSNEWQEKAMSTGINFLQNPFSDFLYVVEYINEFIQASRTFRNQMSVAFPLLKAPSQLKAIEDEIVSVHFADDCPEASVVAIEDDYSGRNKKHDI